MTTSYASLDASIVKAIREFEPETEEEVTRRICPNLLYHLVPWRLKSLRKRGIIEYKNGRWSAVESVK